MIPAKQPRSTLHRISPRKNAAWTPERMALFLRILGATHNVSEAAKAVGVSRQSAYDLRHRLAGQPFDLAWEAAFEYGLGDLAQAALDRALNGIEVSHYHNGELVGTSRRYDERLTMFLLRHPQHKLGAMPAPREYAVQHWGSLLQRIAHGDAYWGDDDADREWIADIKAFREGFSNHQHAIDDDHAKQQAATRMKPKSDQAKRVRWQAGGI